MNSSKLFNQLSIVDQRRHVVKLALEFTQSVRVRMRRMTFLDVANPTSFVPYQIYKSDVLGSPSCVACAIGALVAGLLISQDDDRCIYDLIDSSRSLESRYPDRFIDMQQKNPRRKYYTALSMFELDDLAILESVYIQQFVPGTGASETEYSFLKHLGAVRVDKASGDPSSGACSGVAMKLFKRMLSDSDCRFRLSIHR